MKTEFNHNNGVKTFYASTTELIAEPTASPLDCAVIPSHMGINLVAVEGMSWTRQADGQLVTLTIHFKPAPVAPEPPPDLPEPA